MTPKRGVSVQTHATYEKKQISIQNKMLFCTLHSDFFFKLMEIPVFIFLFMLHFYIITFSLNSLK